MAFDFLGDFRRKLRLNNLELKLIMAGGDPANLAINYGRANAALGNLWPQLERCFVIKKRNVEIECDFESSETLIQTRADITITLGWLLAIVVFYFKTLLSLFQRERWRVIGMVVIGTIPAGIAGVFLTGFLWLSRYI